MNIVGIDFETANHGKHTACSVGIVTMRNGEIIEEFYSLIKPPENSYNYFNTRVHGIRPIDTENAPSFEQVLPEIINRLKGNKVVAHNESFDRNVLKSAMLYYGLETNEINLFKKWECTVSIYKKKKEGRANLHACCLRHGIELEHHNALSDARACAKLYWLHLVPMFGVRSEESKL